MLLIASLLRYIAAFPLNNTLAETAKETRKWFKLLLAACALKRPESSTQLNALG